MKPNRIVLLIIVTLCAAIGLWMLTSGPPKTQTAYTPAATNLAPWVTITRTAKDAKHWEIISQWYVPPEVVGGGPANVYGLLMDQKGLPLLTYRAIEKDGGQAYLTPKLNDAGQAEANFNMSGDSSFAPDRGEVGPYCFRMETFPSDEACGMGIPLKRHVQYFFVFQLKDAGTVPPVTPVITMTPGTPPPDNTNYILFRVARALKLAADDLLAPQ